MIIDTAFMTGLLTQASQSARKRAHECLHQSHQDPVQRIVIGMIPGSYVAPHCHEHSHQFELFVPLAGHLKFICFDNEGIVQQVHDLVAGGANAGIEIAPNQFHTVVAMEPSVFLEVKQGPFDASKAGKFADWAPQEGDQTVAKYLAQLQQCQLGESMALLV